MSAPGSKCGVKWSCLLQRFMLPSLLLVLVQNRLAAVPALCRIVAMLLKLYNRKAKSIQMAISLLLLGGEAKSKVRRLSFISVCTVLTSINMPLQTRDNLHL